MKLGVWQICLMRRGQRLLNSEPTLSFSECLSNDGWVRVAQPSILAAGQEPGALDLPAGHAGRAGDAGLADGYYSFFSSSENVF